MTTPVCVTIPFLLLGVSIPERSVRDGVEQQPQYALAYESLTLVRVNPLGLGTDLRVTGQLRLYDEDDVLLRQNYIGAGLAVNLSPAWARLGGLVEVKPLTILRLWARYVLVQYFGTFDLLASFSDQSANFSDGAIEERADAPGTENQSSLGTELALGADIQLKFGPIAVRNYTRGYYADMDLRSGDTVFYEQAYDVLMEDGGWALTNEADLLYVTDFGLVAGGRYTFTKPFYQRDGGPSNEVQRAGLIAAFRFEDWVEGLVKAPTALLLAQWHIEHRWRTGADVSRAVPYLALGFLFHGDLISPPAPEEK